jgi:hypothetical protein
MITQLASPILVAGTSVRLTLRTTVARGNGVQATSVGSLSAQIWRSRTELPTRQFDPQRTFNVLPLIQSCRTVLTVKAPISLLMLCPTTVEFR